MSFLERKGKSYLHEDTICESNISYSIKTSKETKHNTVTATATLRSHILYKLLSSNVTRKQFPQSKPANIIQILI